MDIEEVEQAFSDAFEEVEDENIEIPKHTVQELFEKEGWKQNNYWDEDEGVSYCTFLNYNLDAIIVIVPEEE